MSSPQSLLHPIQGYEQSLSSLANYLGAEVSGHDVIFTGVTLDSRKVEQGDLFIALPGAKQHGVNFVTEVMSRGAVAIVTDLAGAAIIKSNIPRIIMGDPRAFAGSIAAWFYQNPFASLDAIGITGTNGKTTTASLLEQIWRMDGRSAGFIGTIGILIDGEEFDATFTTPEGTDLQKIVATMRERHVRNLVMEVSSHALSQHRINGAHFTVVGFTNLSQDHLDYHSDMESYFQAKARLFTSEFAKKAIVNIDDAYGLRLYQREDIPGISYSRLNKKADWYYHNFENLERGTGFQIAIRGSGGILIEGELPLLGLHNLDNALLAIALAVESGVDPIAVASYLRHLSAPVGRLEPVNVGQKFLALVDYAHTPDAVTRVLATARTLTDGRVIAVLGCGGDRDRTKRPLMGSALRAGSDFAIFTSDNPRSEDPLAILSEMLNGQSGAEEIVEPDRHLAIALAVAKADSGDCVIVLGKGHERGQEINGVKYPFDDRIELAKAIEEQS